MALDRYEGWVSKGQIALISENEYNDIEAMELQKCAADLVSFVETSQHTLVPLLMGSSIEPCSFLKHSFDGNINQMVHDREHLIETALFYLNGPYLSGGRSPFGIDNAGFTQMVYKINGYPLLRTAREQATQGIALSFIEESEAGDLAFFDNNDGVIDHVGLIMENNYIIHAHEKVRIDRLDHTGIFNTEIGSYTHSLRVIKKVL